MNTILRIITKKIDGVRLINDIDSRFNLELCTEKFDKPIYRMIMKEIDSAEIIADTVIRTPFGVTVMDNLSHGCRTVMLTVLYSGTDIYVPLNECGDNGIKLLFKIAKEYNMDLNVIINRVLSIDEDIECTINGAYYKGGYNIYKRLCADTAIY